MKISYSNKNSISAFLLTNLVKGLKSDVHIERDGKNSPDALNVKTHHEGKPVLHGDLAAVSTILNSRGLHLFSGSATSEFWTLFLLVDFKLQADIHLFRKEKGDSIQKVKLALK